MEKKKFSSMLFLIVPQVIKLIIDNYNIAENTATEWLYDSELYAQLEDEQTKLWHLSPFALFEMFCEEKNTGKITYPEEA